MEIKEVIDRPSPSLSQLLEVWESSVRATHDFLTEQDIEQLRPVVLEGLRAIPSLYCAMDGNAPRAFLGMAGENIEMLFVDAQFRGKGTGSSLIRLALDKGCRFVDVNEQNPQALGFYQHMGFSVIGRDEKDGLGLPFPILHMSLSD